MGFQPDYPYQGAVTGQRPPESQHVNGWITGYTKEGFARYRSHTQGEAGQARPADKRGALWKRPAVLAIPIAAVAVFMLPKIVADSTTSQVKPAATPEAVQQRAVADSPAPLQGPPNAPTQHTGPSTTPTAQPASKTQSESEPESQRWKLIGIITRADGTGLAILQAATGMRRIPAEDCIETATDWRCEVDGQLVAMWSGTGVMSLASSTTYMAADNKTK